MSAPQMIFRGLDGSGDWLFGNNLSSYATGEQAVGLDIQTRLMMFFGDAFNALLFGIQWFQLLSSKNPAAQNGIVLQTRQMILGTVGGYPSTGVTAINAMDVYENPVTRKCVLEYDVATTFSTSLSGSVVIPTQGGS